LVSLVIIQVACGLLISSYHAEAQAQALRARIAARSSAPAKLQIELEFPSEIDVLSFRNSYGGILGLAQRIGTLEATSATGEHVRVEKAAPGEFRSARKVTKFAYEVDVTEPSRPEDMSHISWLNRERGLLMPADLLPRPISGSGNFASVRISLEVPAGWAISSNIERDGKHDFITNEPDKAVFLIGPDLHEASRDLGSSKFRLTTSGQWPFSDAEALKTSRKILDEYSRVTGMKLKGDSSLMLVPFPENSEQGRWSAEARGNVVVLLMGSGGSRKQRLARLGILLSHELFHLWLPNSLSLEGDYDWFFEGFTLYQALLTDMRLRLISFDDYLETIGRVYLSYLASPDAHRLSLIEASEQRWTRSPSLVYDKGMLIAFIYDLLIRNRTSCQTSLSDVYQDLFRSHSTGHGNANEIIIRLLSERGGMEAFVKDHVEGRGELDFESQFSRYGLQIRTNDARARLRVMGSLNKVQRELLVCLGYKS
jgi:predicted metalloprotease with PDZ domain